MITYANEAIDFKGRGLFKALSQVIFRLKMDGTYDTESILASGFTDTVRDYTGMDVRLNIIPNDSLSYAAARIPTFDINHPFLKTLEISNTRITANDSLQLLRKLSTRLKGGIDKKQGRVSGFYSEMTLDIEVTTGMFKMPTIMEEHIAGVLCHELGHLFTYFEFLGTIGFGSMVIGATAKRVMELEGSKERKDIITFGNELLGVDSFSEDDLDKLAADPSQTHVVMLRNYVSQPYLSSDTLPYDYRNIEQLADMFAVKHGAGKAIASYIEITGRANYDKTSLSTSMFIFTGVVSGAYRVLQAFGGPAHAVAALCLSAPGIKLYDDPEARIRYIRQYLASEINAEATGADKEGVSRDIEAIDSILDNVTDRRRLLTVFWESIPGKHNSRRKQEIAAKQLESMIYNDLTYQAEQLTNNVNTLNA